MPFLKTPETSGKKQKMQNRVEHLAHLKKPHAFRMTHSMKTTPLQKMNNGSPGFFAACLPHDPFVNFECPGI